MSSILMDCPTLKINQNELDNLIQFTYKHEQILKFYGGFKIQLDSNCQLALKKRKKSLELKAINKQIVKRNSNDQFYLVKDLNGSVHQKKSLIKNESTFWSSLVPLNCEKGKELNISICENKSFFSSKTSRQYFDLNRLPNQSLLKLGGKKLTKQFSPYVKRTYEGGGIFPLNSTQLYLSSINYHHEGGVIYWYIIPNSERENLSKLLNQNKEEEEDNSSICIDHQQVFISPEFLEKNHIRHYKICQYPNEFIVLLSGSLSQSFSFDSSWSESIDFALPSWIEENHLNKFYLHCQCNSLLPSLNIDMNLFRPQPIQNYIHLHLNNNQVISLKDNQDIERIPTSISIQSNPLNDERTSDETNFKVNIPLKRIGSSLLLFPTSTITPPLSNYFDEQQNQINSVDNQVQYQFLEEGIFPNIFDVETSDINIIDSISNEDLSQTNIDQNLSNNSNLDSYFLSYEELMKVLPSNLDNHSSTYQQPNENIHQNIPSIVSSKTDLRTINNQNHMGRTKVLTQTTNNRTTLFVSGLRSDVNKIQLHDHFIDCIKVTIKQSHTSPHLKYAFVLHRTCEQAKSNLHRPINYSLFGPRCLVQYASNCSTLSNNDQNVNKKKLAVNRIPENVTENDLQHLFFDGHIVKYSPARTIYSTSATTMKMNGKNKILLGYAFILYDNEQQAANVIKHSDQYQINGQPLVISLYRNKKLSNRTTTTAITTRRELNVN